MKASAQSSEAKMLLMHVFSVESGLKPRHLDSQPSTLALPPKKSYFYVSFPLLSLFPH